MSTSTENYSETLARLKKQLVTSRFLRWWLGELASMAPAWLRSAGLDAGSFTLVRLDQASALLCRLENGALRDVGSVALQSLDAAGQRQAFQAVLGQLPASRREIALMLPPGRVLCKTLTLPLATEENLRQVLEFQIEQHTPFSPGDVYFGCRVLARDFQRGQLTLEFAATPRDAVDQALKTLNTWGAPVRAVVAQDMLAATELVNLLPAAQGRAPSRLMRGLNPWLAGLLVLLALAAMAMPLLIKREAVVQLQPWVEKGKQAAQAADALRRQLETRVDQHNYLLEKRQALPPVIMALEELTRVLPDDTWVQQLDIKGKELQIHGETASSFRLIGLFEQSGMFHDASFRAPLTKGQSSGAERYQLALQMQPMVGKVATVATPPAAAATAPSASSPVALPLAAASVPVAAQPSASAPSASAAAPKAPENKASAAAPTPEKKP